MRIAQMNGEPSIFLSVDGEVNAYGQGSMSTFIRTFGCNLECSYCDSPHAKNKEFEPVELSLEKIMDSIENIGCQKITITGGEPLIQIKDLHRLLVLLDDAEYNVTVETNGSLEIPYDTYSFVSWIVDFKLPSSGTESNKVHYRSLGKKDFIKFVVADRKDFDYALQTLVSSQLYNRDAKKAFSCVQGSLDPATLFEWMKEAKLFDCILNVQIHKMIWPSAMREI